MTALYTLLAQLLRSHPKVLPLKVPLSNDLHASEWEENSRSYWRALKRTLPYRINHIADRAIGRDKLMSKVLPELRDTNNISRSLILERDEQNNPYGVDAPGARPRILPERSKFADIVVFGIGKVAELCDLASSDGREVFIDLHHILFRSQSGSHDGWKEGGDERG